MRDGFRIYDPDTHVLPAAEVLELYVDPSFRPRLAELAPYRVPIRRGEDGAANLHYYRVGQLRVELSGKLAGILALAADIKKPGGLSPTGLAQQIKMIAGLATPDSCDWSNGKFPSSPHSNR